MPLILIPITIVVLGILGFAHAVVYEALITIASVLSPDILSQHVIAGLRVAFVVLALSFTVMTFFSFCSRNIVTKIAYKISAIWTGLLMYLFFAGFAYGALIFLSNLFFGEYAVSAVFETGLACVGCVLFIAAIVTGVYGVIHARHMRVTKVAVQVPNMPQSWKSKKAVWVSDIHLGHIRGAAFLETMVKNIQALKPDIVFIGGDLFDGVKIDENAAIASLSDLCARTVGPRTPHVARDGVYFIMGNHEEFSEKSSARFLKAVKSVPNLRVLEDEVVTVDGVDIIGVDHGHTDTAAKYTEVLMRLHPGKAARPSILLKHEPRDLDIALTFGISFQISGHTHRGQVFPATLLAWLVFPGFNYGLHERIARGDAVNADRDSMLVYTSSGVGTWGPPLRVGTDSEIVIFEFK